MIDWLAMLIGDVFAFQAFQEESNIHWNSDTFGELAEGSTSYEPFELVTFLQMLDAWRSLKKQAPFMRRTLRSPLVPLELPQWRNVMLAYYAKTLVRGQRPMQDVTFLKTYMINWILRIISRA